MTSEETADAYRLAADYLASAMLPVAATTLRAAADKLDPPLPPEPVAGSVAVDRHGDAWGRGKQDWKFVNMVGTKTSWASLIRDHGPVTVVHVGRSLS